MPMNPDALTKDILNTFRTNMKQVSPDAEPQEFQEHLAKAVAEGTINVLKTSTTVGVAPFPVLVPGVNGIGLTVDGILMTMTSANAMRGFSGGGGIALDKSMEALMLPVQRHLATSVEVVSISGFGGQGLSPAAPPPLFEAAILAALPPKISAQMIASSQGKFFIKAISLGLSAGISAGIPGIVPFGSTPPAAGPFAGIFK